MVATRCARLRRWRSSLTGVLEVVGDRVARPTAFGAGQQVGGLRIERRRVRHVRGAATALETADQPDERGTADPWRTAGAVHQTLARQRGEPAVADRCAALTPDG